MLPDDIVLVGWLSPRVVAEATGVVPRTIRNYAFAGRIPAKRVGHRWLISPSAIPMIRGREVHRRLLFPVIESAVA